MIAFDFPLSGEGGLLSIVFMLGIEIHLIKKIIDMS
jgi:hypothetical protein